jgi:hypothetical protein
MLRKRHQYRMLTVAFLFALIGVAFFAGYAGIRSQTLQPQPTQPPPESGHQRHQEPEGFWERATGDPVAIATLALVFVTFLMTRAIREQVRLARDEFNATHRPHITIHTIEQSAEGASDRIGAHIAYVNIGGAPCTVLELRGIILWQDAALRPGILEMVPPDQAFKVCSIAPGEIGGCTLFSADTTLRTVAVQDQRAIRGQGPRQTLFCIGYLRYVDVRRIERRTGFCRRYESTLRLWNREHNPDYEYSY